MRDGELQSTFEPDPVKRFWAKVDKQPGEGCWLWTGGGRSRGYGQYTLGFRVVLAHRHAYELEVGPIPEGKHLDHLCRTPLCVRPTHLEPVTPRENVLRGVSFAAHNAAKTHCPQGHEYTPENTYTWKGRRFCRPCGRKRTADYKARH